MSYLEELLPEFRKGAKIRRQYWPEENCISINRNMGLHLSPVDTQADDWALFQEPDPDWQYIIDHKCLCWFWYDCFEAANIGLLGDIYKECNLKYVLIDEDGNRGQYLNCRPVRRDEVTFYEDKKDVL